MCAVEADQTHQILLTRLSYDYIVGEGGSVLVPRCALKHALVIFRPRHADVHHQRARVGLHGYFGVLVNVKVGPIFRPGKTEKINVTLNCVFILNCNIANKALYFATE